ncbi:MAG TPA: sigma-70 family RNA polymerase sigma factor [Planctomycetota bacterium]|jgi:RNA polymerase sigma-70 factor (ECF subfamily)|nr:sigma-70 family RNA polymerase sigma factor [Planctomycetota bacterium]
MRAETSSSDVEDLLSQAPWMRRLARRLVRDAAQADDLVQETYLAALRSAPTEEERRKPWLVRVLRNFAAQTWRGDAHRARREEVAAKCGASPSASETAERLEAQRLLLEALRALEEPYRTTVTLRYLDGLSAARIARRQGIPAGTVRWRLKRGLDELRARLDRRSGGRGAWCVAFLPLVRRPPVFEAVTASALAAKGVLLMNTATKIGAIAATLAASAGVWWAVERGDPARNVTVARREKPRVEAAVDSARGSGPAAPEAAGPRAPLPPPVDPGRASPAAEPPASAGLVARFVDRWAQPIAGVQVLFPDLPGAPTATSDREGRTSVQVDPPPESRPARFEASCRDYATRFDEVFLDRGRTKYLGDVVLAPGGAVAGLVIGPEGEPVQGAEVLVTGPDIRAGAESARRHGPAYRRNVVRGRTAENGTFRVDGAPVALVRVWAGTEDLRYEFTDPIETQAGSVRDGIVLRLERLGPKDVLAGCVRGPDGSPVPGAKVTYRYFDRSMEIGGELELLADPAGRFRLRPEALVPYQLEAHDPQGRWPDVSAKEVAPGTIDLVLQFVEPRGMDLLVREKGGGPIESFHASVFGADGDRSLHSSSGGVHPGGKVRVPIPSQPFEVQVRARGHARERLGPWTPELAPASLLCELERVPSIRGRVTAGGNPVAGVRLSLVEMAGVDERVDINGFASRFHAGNSDSTRTDADGRFEMWAGRAGRFAIFCEGEGWALAELSPLELDPKKPVDGLEVSLVRGGVIEGRVLVAEGCDPSGVIVAINRGDSRARTLRVGPDGLFRFERLTPGRWHVFRSAVESPPLGQVASNTVRPGIRTDIPWNCLAEDGRATRFDLDLTSARPSILLGQVSVNGRPASGWTATALLENPSRSLAIYEGSVDPDGRLRIEFPEPGRFGVVLRAPGEGWRGLAFEVPVDLLPGENDWPLDLAVGAVKGWCGSKASGRIHLRYEAGERGSVWCAGLISTDERGAFAVPFVLAGRGKIARIRDEEGEDAGAAAEREVEVPAGGSVEIQVP